MQNSRTKNKELLEYMQYIHRLAENEMPDEFTNSGPDRAAVVFNELYSNSNKVFRLYAGNLGGDISSKILYTSGIRQFLQRKSSKLLILLEDLSKFRYNTELYSILCDFSDKVQLKKSLVKPYLEGDEESRIHFSVGDDNMYRLELDSTHFKAVGSFNNPEESKILSNLFDEIFNSSDHSENVSLI